MPKYIPEVKINNETYFVKDSEARELIENLSQSINIYANAGIIRDTVQNSPIVSIPDGAGLPLTSLLVQIDPIQEGSGEPSPNNVRLINGRASMTVFNAGVNYIDIDDLISASSGVIGSYTFKHKLTLQLKPNTRYTLSTSYDGSNNVLYFDGTDASDTVKKNSPQTRTSNSSGELVIGLFDRTGVEEFENKTVFVVLDETTTHRSHVVQFGQTIYGAQIDWTAETVICDRALFVPTTVTQVNTASTGVQFAICGYTPIETKMESALSLDKNISSEYQFRKTTAPSDSGWFRINGQALYIFDNRFTDVATAQGIIESEQPQFIYELNTPIEIPLSDVDVINMVNGENNVWADCGNIIEMTYVCDAKAYIEKRFLNSSANGVTF